MPIDPRSGVFYELHGTGKPLMIGLPLMASQRAIFGDAGLAIERAYLDALTERYCVLTMDYPSIGRSADIAPEALTADRVCADLLAVADAAGFERFAYVGYSWSGAVGLQLAARTDRLAALVIGGWPPSQAPYAAMRAATRLRIENVPLSAMVVLRNAQQYAQWSAFYDSIGADWDEGAVAERPGCPAMVFFGSEGDLEEAGHAVPIASTIRATRTALEAAGWRVREYLGYGHHVGLEPSIAVPDIVNFLREVWP